MNRILPILLAATGVAAAQTPPNDAQTAAFRLTGSTLLLDGDLQGATREAFEPESPRLAGTSIWWQWTAPSTGIWTWESTIAPTRTLVTVLSADTLGQWQVEAESALRPRSGSGAFGLPEYDASPKGSLVAEAGRDYWIRIDAVRPGGFFIGGDGTPGSSPQPVRVTFSPSAGQAPPNDRFSVASDLPLASPVLKGILMQATSEPGEPRAHEAALGRTLWWRFQAPGRGTVSLTFPGDAEPPAVAVYRRGAWDRLEPLGNSVTEFGNECARYWRARNEFSFDTAEAGPYFLQVDAVPGRDLEGSFAGTLAFQPAPPEDDLAGAVALTGTAWGLAASNLGATGSPGEPQVPGQEGSSSVWFRWDTPAGGLVQVTVGEPVVFAEPNAEVLPPGGGGAGGGVIIIVNPPCGGAFADLHPRPPFVPILGFFQRFGSSGDRPLLEYRTQGTNEVWAEITGGESWIWLDGPAGATGATPLNGRLTLAPSNDRRDDRVVLPSAAVRVTGRSAGSRAEPGERLPAALVAQSSPPSGTPRRSVWWEWRAPSADWWVLRPVVGMGDHCFALYLENAGSEGEPLDWTTDRSVAFQALAGQGFHLGVFGLSGLGSNLEFVLEPVPVPELGVPSIRTVTGVTRWTVPLPTGWQRPVDAEISTDLERWTPVASDWFPDSSELAVPWPPADAAAGFLRVRVR